jgi:hypothetical protein
MSRHPAAYIVAEDNLTAADCEPDPLLDAPDARLRPDPWLPYSCPRCGDEDRSGMPRNCTCCGFQNYGGNE